MNIEIIVKLYGVESRRKMIDSTAKKLSIPDNNIFLDDRENGGNPLYTAKKAYLSEHGTATHGIFLQDDIEVCNNFLDICHKIIEAHPEKIVSLFPFDYQKENPIFENLNTPYVRAHTLSGCGIIMPIKYINPCFKWIDNIFNENQITDDGGIERWALKHNVEIITTIPSLIQHIGDVSLANPYFSVRRTVYYKENPIADWSNNSIFETYKPYLDFAPKCKNIIKLGG